MENTFQTDLERLREDIQLKLIGEAQRLWSEHKIYFAFTESELKFCVDAVLARLFVLSYGAEYDYKGTAEIKTARSNVYQWTKKKMDEDDMYCGASSDLKDSIEGQLRYNLEKKKRYHYKELEFLGREDLIEIQSAERERGAKNYDLANFELIGDRDDTFKINDYITNERIKTIDHKLLAEAFFQIDKYYDDAKEMISGEVDVDDKILYIAKWVNMYRMEVTLHITWIEKIAEYLVENKYPLKKIKTDNTNGERIEIKADEKMPLGMKKLNIDSLSLLFGTIKIGEGSPVEAWYDIPYYTSIKWYFDCVSEHQFDNNFEKYLNMRMILNGTVGSLLKAAHRVFTSYIYGVPEAIEIMFQFCKETFPIIEMHQNSKIYKTGKTGRKYEISKNEKYVKAARNFMVLFYYEKNIVPMAEMAAEVQKEVNSKHSKK